MLRKLLKYDMQSIWRIWIWLAAASLLVALPGGVCMRFLVKTMLESPAFAILQMLAVFGVFISFLVIAAALLVTEILVFWRFYKHFFTDEGYLTFTLPVSRAKLLLSKTLNACIWLAAGLAVMLLSFLEILLITDAKAFLTLLDGIGLLLSLGGGWVVLWIVELLLLLALLLWWSISIVHLCITIGSIIAKKHKLLAAIGIYYLVGTVMGFAMEILMIVGIFSATGALEVLLTHVTAAEGNALISLLLLIACVIVATVSYFVHLLTLNKLEQRLNLA